MTKFYMRIPKCTDDDGTYARLLFPAAATVELTDRDIQLLHNSAVVKVTQTEVEFRVKSTGEHLHIKLPTLPIDTLVWVWMSQPRYKPGDKITGFVVIRDRINKYMTAIRRSKQTGHIRLVDEQGVVILTKPMDFAPMVTLFEFPTTEHHATGKYSVQLITNPSNKLASFDVELAHFEKKELVVQLASPSWINIGDVADVRVSASYYHGDPVRDGSATISYGTTTQTYPLYQGFVKIPIEALPLGNHTISVTVTSGAYTETKFTQIIVADRPAIIKCYNPPKPAQTQIPVKLAFTITDPASKPIPHHPIVIKWQMIGKLETKALDDHTQIIYSDDHGMAALTKTFAIAGTYEYTASTEIHHETVSVVDKLVIDRIVQGYFTIEHTLDRDTIADGDPITGHITLRGHDDTIPHITTAFVDLITDRIVETKRITLTDNKGQYTFAGVADFYGTFAVDFYIPTNTLEIDRVSTLATDKAGCVVSRVEGVIEPPHPICIDMTVEAPAFAPTGSKISLNVTVTGDLVCEDFHVFGALVDHRVLLEHADSRLRQVFLKRPEAMAIEVRESESPPPPRRYGGEPVLMGFLGGSGMGARARMPPPGGAPPGASYHTTYRGDSNVKCLCSTTSSPMMRSGIMDELKTLFTHRIHASFSDDVDEAIETFSALHLAQKLVRSNFASSIMIPPCAVVNKRARIEVTLPDAISTYELFLFGVGDRQVSEVHVPIVVKNAIYTQLLNPAQITLHDMVELKLVIQNTTAQPEIVHVSIPKMENIHTNGDITWEIDVPAQSVQHSSFSVIGDRVGYAAIEVEVRGQRIYESVGFDQPLYIKPPNEPTTTTQTAIVDTHHPTSDFTIDLAGDEAHSIGVISILPAMESAIIDGLEALIQYPHGCCEQTCASTLPNVIVFEYLDARQQLTPQLKETLLGHMMAGFTLLMKYHNPDGGFSYWGGASSPFYTALAMSVIARMIPYIHKGENVIAEAQAYLCKLATSEGGWRSDDFHGHGAVAPVNLDDVSLTTYIVHSMALAKIANIDAMRWISQQIEACQVPAILGMVMEAWKVCDEYQTQFPDLPKRCSALLQTSVVYTEDGAGWSGRGTLTGVTNISVESTAYALLGLHACFPMSAEILDLCEKGVHYLLSTRGTRGWHTTRDTLMASTAITRVSQADKPNFTLDVTMNDHNVCHEVITPENVGWKAFNLRGLFVDHLQPHNTIRVTIQGTGKCHAVVETRRWYATPPPRQTMPIRIDRDIRIGDSVTMVITMTPDRSQESVMLEESIPPILRVTNLEELMRVCDHAEIQHDKLCIFFARLDTPRTLVVECEKIGKGQCMVETLRAYAMYDPTNEILLAPALLEL